MLDALTLDQIRMFVTVAEAGSFRAGAAKLARVQSAVSHSIANLEAQLSVVLFDRTGHRPTLTDAGRVLLEDARAVLLKIDFMRARGRGLRQGLESELSLVVDALFPLSVAAAALGDLRADYPTVGVRLSVAPLGGPLTALKERAADLAIVVGEDFADPRIARDMLASLRFIAVAGARHPLAALARRQRAVGADELADHVQIVQIDPSPLSEGRDFGVLSPGTWRVTTQDAKHALIKANIGWGRLPFWLVERDLAERQLVRVRAPALGRDGETMVNAYLARRMDEALGPAGRALGEALARRVEMARSRGAARQAKPKRAARPRRR